MNNCNQLDGLEKIIYILNCALAYLEYTDTSKIIGLSVKNINGLIKLNYTTLKGVKKQTEFELKNIGNV